MFRMERFCSNQHFYWPYPLEDVVSSALTPPNLAAREAPRKFSLRSEHDQNISCLLPQEDHALLAQNELPRQGPRLPVLENSSGTLRQLRPLLRTRAMIHNRALTSVTRKVDGSFGIATQERSKYLEPRLDRGMRYL